MAEDAGVELLADVADFVAAGAAGHGIEGGGEGAVDTGAAGEAEAAIGIADDNGAFAEAAGAGDDFADLVELRVFLLKGHGLEEDFGVLLHLLAGAAVAELGGFVGGDLIFEDEDDHAEGGDHFDQVKYPHQQDRNFDGADDGGEHDGERPCHQPTDGEDDSGGDAAEGGGKEQRGNEQETALGQGKNAVVLLPEGEPDAEPADEERHGKAEPHREQMLHQAPAHAHQHAGEDAEEQDEPHGGAGRRVQGDQDGEGHEGRGERHHVEDVEAAAEILRRHRAEEHDGRHEDADAGDGQPDAGLGAAEDFHFQLDGGEHPANQPEKLAVAGGGGLAGAHAQRGQGASLEPKGAEHGDENKEQNERRRPVEIHRVALSPECIFGPG